MKKTSVLGAMAGMALAGCTMFQTLAVARDCDRTKSDCPIPVTVTPSGDGCTIADPGTTLVKKNHKPELVWSLTGTQFKFVQKGIEFTSKSDDPTGVFDDKGPKHGGQEYRVKDKNNHKTKPGDPPKRYSYKITVVKQDGSPGCFLDPIVANEGCDDGTC